MKRLLIFLTLAACAAAQPLIQIQTAAWTSATATGSTLVLPTQQGAAASVFFTRSGTVSQGPVVAFEGSPQPDNQTGTDWFAVPCVAPTTSGTQYDLTTTANVAFQCNVVGFQRFRLRLSTAIGSTGTINASALMTNASVPTTPNPAMTGGTTTVSGTVTANQGTQGSSGSPWFTSAIVPPTTSYDSNTLSQVLIVTPDPCTDPFITKKPFFINTTGTGTIISNVSGQVTKICSLNIVTATAQNIALVHGHGSNCATGTLGMSGGNTAATGWNFAANGGLVFGNGSATVLDAITPSDDVCLLLSGSGQTSGGGEFVTK